MIQRQVDTKIEICSKTYQRVKSFTTILFQDMKGTRFYTVDMNLQGKKNCESPIKKNLSLSNLFCNFQSVVPIS